MSIQSYSISKRITAQILKNTGAFLTSNLTIINPQVFIVSITVSISLFLYFNHDRPLRIDFCDYHLQQVAFLGVQETLAGNNAVQCLSCHSGVLLPIEAQ